MTSPPFLTSALLAAAPGVRHAFFTRRGGVSEGLWASLNVGYGSGDEASRVTENRRRAAAVLGRDESALTTAYQTHSALALVAQAPWGAQRPTGDAIVSGAAGVICGVLSADCAPILVADAEARVIAAIHAGWRGALSGIVASAIAAMTELGAKSSRMVAAIGPCVAQASYEVGPEFLAQFEDETADAKRFFGPGRQPDRRQFDLAAFAAARLAESGVAQCEWIGLDTAGDEGAFFSNRRAYLRGEADYGRLLSAIALDQDG
jgi:YfiH family protein